MRYLLDTDHCSYIQRKHPQVMARLTSLPIEAEVMTSVFSVAELLSGLYRVPSEARRQQLRAVYEAFLQQVADILVPDLETAEQYAQILNQLTRDGKPIPINDVWIAATARARGLILVSHDAHYKYIENLITEDWTVP
jgi:predicted nucleic acid-binding protein